MKNSWILQDFEKIDQHFQLELRAEFLDNNLRAPSELIEELPSVWSRNHAGHWGQDGLFGAKTWTKGQWKSPRTQELGWMITADPFQPNYSILS